MSQSALCPSCQKEVVFNTSEGASVCPACGARFELSTDGDGGKRRRHWYGLIFIAWMFAPSIVALLGLALLPRIYVGLLVNFAWFFGIVSLASCYASCSWFMSRFTKKLWARIVVGIFLGTGIFICNAIVAVLAGCISKVSHR